MFLNKLRLLAISNYSRQLAVRFGMLMLVATWSASSFADVTLPTILSDHMVLQRDMELPIWGWAEPGEEVTVAIAGQTHTAKADAEGNWHVTLDPLSLGEPLTMVVEGKNRLEVSEILVGEVWLCSGQSNMQWELKQVWNADLDMATAKYPNIRLLTVNNPASQTPTKNVDGQWNACTPETAGRFSAVGYFFGRQLHQMLEVPIGLVDNAWGGSACEAWIRRDRLAGNTLYEPLMERWKKTEAEFDVTKERAEYGKKLAAWEKEVAELKQDAQMPHRPRWNNPLENQHRPANLYHGRLMPIMPFGIRGVIWYQGETNAGRAYQYREMFPLMIQSWREDWQQGDFPFYWVQLADYTPERPEPGDSDWAELREAQTMTLDRLPHTGEAVIIDLGEASDIHPRNKVDVAKRLARWALARDYGVDIPYQSPRYESMDVGSGKIVVRINTFGSRLRTVDSREVQGFAIAGEDRHWVRAQAALVGKGRDRIEVWSKEIPKPVAVRYAWANNPVCNVYCDNGLPLTPFRTDYWSGVTAEAR